MPPGQGYPKKAAKGRKKASISKTPSPKKGKK